MDQWINGARLFEAAGPDPATVAVTARPSVGQGIVTTVCEAVVEAQLEADANDARLGQLLKRGPDARRVALPTGGSRWRTPARTPATRRAAWTSAACTCR